VSPTPSLVWPACCYSNWWRGFEDSELGWTGRKLFGTHPTLRAGLLLCMSVIYSVQRSDRRLNMGHFLVDGPPRHARLDQLLQITYRSPRYIIKARTRVSLSKAALIPIPSSCHRCNLRPFSLPTNLCSHNLLGLRRLDRMLVEQVPSDQCKTQIAPIQTVVALCCGQ
jgi:hypothetical protein